MEGSDYVIGVFEDNDGGHELELGEGNLSTTYILKRDYSNASIDNDVEYEKYDAMLGTLFFYLIHRVNKSRRRSFDCVLMKLVIAWLSQFSIVTYGLYREGDQFDEPSRNSILRPILGDARSVRHPRCESTVSKESVATASASAPVSASLTRLGYLR